MVITMLKNLQKEGHYGLFNDILFISKIPKLNSFFLFGTKISFNLVLNFDIHFEIVILIQGGLPLLLFITG